jgi:hypothetical protein
VNTNWEIFRDVLAGLIGGSVGGAITGAVGAHFLAKSRDANNRAYLSELSKVARKRDFLAYLKQMEIEVGVGFHPGPSHSRVAQQFSERRPVFAAEVIRIEQDFSGGKLIRFTELTSAISETTPGEINSTEGNQKLLGAIRKLFALVKEN